MSDDLSVKITLSALDRASPVIRGLTGNIERLKRVADSLKPSGQIHAFAKAYAGLGEAQQNWAANLHHQQRHASAGFARLRTQVQDLDRSFGKLRSHNFGPSKASLSAWRNFRSTHIRDSANRMRLERQIAEVQSGMVSARNTQERRIHSMRLGELRSRAAEEDRAERQRVTAHRNALSRARELSRIPSNAASRLTGHRVISPSFASVIVSGAAIAGARQLIGVGADGDTAETMARIHAYDGLSPQQSRATAAHLRANWAVPEGYRMGVTSEDMLRTFTEVRKSGVADEAMAKEAARLGIMASKTLELDIDDTIQQMGYAIAGEYGSGRLKDIAGVHALINTATSLASQSAANPAQMMSFLRTGLGAGANMGLTQAQTLAFGALAVESGAEGQQAARMLSTMGTRLSELSIDERETRAKGTLTASDREFLAAPQMLGYSGGWRGIESMLATDPSKIFDFINSFSAIDDDAMRKRMMHEVFGQEFVRFIEQMLQRPASSAKLRKIADQAYGETQGQSFIDRAYGVWTESMAFEMGRIASAWNALADAFGRAFKPFLGDLAGYAGTWLNKVDAFAGMFTASLDGFVDGLLGYDGTFRDLLQNMFGDPSIFEARSKAFYDFFQGAGAGIRQVYDGFKTLLNLFPGMNANMIGDWTGKILALSFALAALSPLLSVLGGLTAILMGFVSLGQLAKGALGASAGGAAIPPGASGFLKGGVAGAIATLLGERLIDGTLKAGTPAFDALLGITPEMRSQSQSQAADPWSNTAQRFGNLFSGKGFVTDQELPGFAHGGSFTVGGAGGTDTQLVSFWATPGERVSVSTPNQMGGGGILINLRTAGIEDRLGDIVSALYRLAGVRKDNSGRAEPLDKIKSRQKRAPRSTHPYIGTLTSAAAHYDNLPGGGALGSTPYGPNFYYPNLTPPGSVGGSYTSGTPGNAFFDAIIKVEGTARDGNPYNEVLGYGAYGRPSKPLTQMTLNEVKAFGLEMRRKQQAQGKPWEKTSSASGAFQIVGATMMDAAAALGMDPSTTIFNEETQKRMAHWIAQKQGLGAWEGFKHHPNERQRAAAAMAAGVNPLMPSSSIAGTGGITLDGVPIKGGLGGQAFGGGAHAMGLEALAQELYLGGVPGGLNRFTAFNDYYHAGSSSKHAKGLATDFTILDPSKSREAAEAVRRQFRAAGLTDDMFKVIDEYANPSARSTGGHIHAQFQSGQAAALYQSYIVQQRAMAAAAQTPSSVSPQTTTAQQAMSNVPFPSSQGMGGGGMGAGGSSPPVNITINGANQNAEQIANLVQRRINESWNWRAHDVEHNLT